MFCLLVVLVKLSVLTKWLASKTPLRKPVHGKIISTKPRPKRAYHFRFNVLFHCFIVCLYCFPALPQYISYSMVRYSLFLLKVRLNTNHPDILPSVPLGICTGAKAEARPRWCNRPQPNWMARKQFACCCSTIGDRSVAASASRVWNSLPSRVTSSSLTSFKRHLKTELYTRSFIQNLLNLRMNVWVCM